MVHRIEVVVVGGGYAGVKAANRLARHREVKVTLVNPRPYFTERIRLHQLAAGSHPAVVDYRRVLARKVGLVVDTVVALTPDSRHVHLTDGSQLRYDYVIYALGSGSAEPGVPGAAEFAYRCGSLEEAQQLRSRLAATPQTAPVTVVGGGPTGIETAAELAEIGREVTLVCGGRLGPYLHPRGRGGLRSQLRTLGVRVLEDPGTRVSEVTAREIWLDDGSKLLSHITVWTAGFSVPALAAESGLATDEHGCLLTNDDLTSISDPRVIAAGDAAAPAELGLRMSCQAAIPLGAHAAATILNHIRGKKPKPVRVSFVGQALSLGRGTGLIQFASTDDSAVKWYLKGWVAATVKELVCRGTITLVASGKHSFGSLRWVKHPRRRTTLRPPQGQTSAIVTTR